MMGKITPIRREEVPEDEHSYDEVAPPPEQTLFQSKYNPDFHPLAVVEMMAGDGMSMAQVCAEFGISRETLRRWTKKYPEMAEAYSMAQAGAEAHWEDIGKGLVLGAKGNALAWIFIMKNRFKWMDKKELSKGMNKQSIRTMIEELEKNRK